MTSDDTGGYRVSVFDASKGSTDRLTLPAGTSLDQAKAAAQRHALMTYQSDTATPGVTMSGRVLWYNNARGFGFITPQQTVEASERVLPPDQRELFVHWSSILMDGERDLQHNELVEFDCRKLPKGWAATSVIKATSPDSENFRELLRARRDRMAITLLDGALRVIRIGADSRIHFLDDTRRHHGLLYLQPASSRVYEDAVAELEHLINTVAVREQTLHDFFERYPEFILSSDYKAAHSKILLESAESSALIPDFILEPVGQKKLCDLLELKLPTARVEVLPDRRARFAATVLEARAQLRTYSDYFEDASNRARFSQRYGLAAFRPRMYVIIGRRGSIDPVEWRRLEDDLPALHVRTYDDILERARHLLERFGTLHHRG